jgi:hypothetical protein
MKKYLLVIARYKDQRQDFFEKLISPLNKKYCEKWGRAQLKELNKNNRFSNYIIYNENYKEVWGIKVKA